MPDQQEAVMIRPLPSMAGAGLMGVYISTAGIVLMPNMVIDDELAVCRIFSKNFTQSLENITDSLRYSDRTGAHSRGSPRYLIRWIGTDNTDINHIA